MIRAKVEAANPKFDKSIEHLSEQLKTIRTGRASTSLVENIVVDYYGVPQPLKAIATINTPDARSISITPWDKAAMASVEKAIRDAQSLGLNPMNDGAVIRLAIPPLTDR